MEESTPLNDKDKKPENPFAFPKTGEVVDGYCGHAHSGMTLRDYFAAKAIPSVIRDYCENGASDFLSHPADMEIVAEVSYQIADAMLRYRNK